MLNDPSTPLSAVRQPRMRVLLNGFATAGCVSVSVNSNNHFAADTFESEFTATAQDFAMWGGTDTLLAEVQIDRGLNGPEGFVSTFTGEVDDIELDPILGSVRVHGRDLSRRLRDARTQETFANQTSSQVATTLAGRHGLTPVVTATTTLVSRYYGADHDHLTGDEFTRTTTEWDLLVYLAQQEGFDLFVQAMELHFQPGTDIGAQAFIVRLDTGGPYFRCNVIQPELRRSLTLAKDIEVWVRSWNTAKKAGFTKKAGGKVGKSGPGPKQPAQRIVLVRPNLTEDQAQKLANSVREDLTKNERLLDFSLPGDTSFSARGLVRLEGTGSSWDTTYFVSSIERHLDMQGGFTMRVACKNHDPANQSIPL